MNMDDFTNSSVGCLVFPPFSVLLSQVIQANMTSSFLIRLILLVLVLALRPPDVRKVAAGR